MGIEIRVSYRYIEWSRTAEGGDYVSCATVSTNAFLTFLTNA